ncbi:MAG: hypothetical protein A4E63_02241 [Syntrophorhabdus sp. PtaU1.Bin050]|nr:MAG: hypothetical protein A4E63_02241 [Syntrophorhabdus sp. PtaU1.Bin050]
MVYRWSQSAPDDSAEYETSNGSTRITPAITAMVMVMIGLITTVIVATVIGVTRVGKG